MSGTERSAGWLAATALVAAVIGCAGQESGAAGQHVRTIDDGIAWLSPAERELANLTSPADEAAGLTAPTGRSLDIPMEDVPPHEWATYGYTPPAAASER